MNFNRQGFEQDAIKLLHHRGPDDNGIYKDSDIALVHTRLSIIELSTAGHQPMFSSCGRFVICYNGEIYNHRELRRKYLQSVRFKGESDTETIVELYRLIKAKMLDELLGMWSILIWDTEDRSLFISRDRYGQKPLYYRQNDGHWLFASEIRPLLGPGEKHRYHEEALLEFLASGNYGHLGDKTFFNSILQFPQGSYAIVKLNDPVLHPKKYWQLPDIPPREKRPFDDKTKKELHDVIVDAVLSQTLSDVPIGITLSGGVDSSIIAGIMATYYDRNINVFTAQAIGSPSDETRYVNSVLERYPHLNVHRCDLKRLSLKEDLEKYIEIQEEPFGDPSIMAHGYLMQIAASNKIKVVLGGQGADELFFGYANMIQAVFLRQLRGFRINSFIRNLSSMEMPRSYIARTMLLSVFPGLERNLRMQMRKARKKSLQFKRPESANSLFLVPRYDDFYDVWCESVYGIHLPHLLHYDDRNAMANSIEGRMPFLDHRVAECVATIRPEYFLKNGISKYVLREACSDYLPEQVKKRKDKIGFYTPLVQAIYNDRAWLLDKFRNSFWIKDSIKTTLHNKIVSDSIDINDALLIWRFLVANCWKQQFNIVD